MENYYFRGNTLVFPFSLQNEDEEEVKFEVDDILRFGAKESIYSDEYALYKEIVISEETSEIQFEFETEETQKLKPRNYIIELELTRGNIVSTVYQESILIKGAVIRYVPKDNSSTETA